MKIFKVDRGGQAKKYEPEPPYDPEPKFFYPATCPSCGDDDDDCIMCKDQTPIHAARLSLPDMTIRRQR